MSIEKTIELLTFATAYDAAKFASDTRREYLIASTELRDNVRNYAAALTDAQQIERNLAETRAILALLQQNNSLTAEVIEHLRACAENILEGCRQAATV